MTHSRREFLQLAGFSIVAIAMPRLPAWLTSGHAADLPEFGMRLEIPGAWRFVAGADLETIRAETTLPGGEEAKARVMAMAGEPLLVAARERHPTPGPTLVVWRQAAEQDHHAADEHDAFASIHEHTYRRYTPYMRDFTVVEGGRPERFAGSPASTVVVRFRDESVRGTSWPVRLESHMLRWQHSWLTFNFLDLADGWTPAAREEFRAIERSLVLYTAAEGRKDDGAPR